MADERSTPTVLQELLSKLQQRAVATPSPFPKVPVTEQKRAPHSGPTIESSKVDENEGSVDDHTEAGETPPGRYDFDLAEFPVFRFDKVRSSTRDRTLPLVYSDTISGKDGTPVIREWKAYPSPFGFGGASTQELLYDLLQMYIEQGCRGTQIRFGTLRELFLRRGERNPSARDYTRLRRDLDILCGYRFECRNAFWDRERRAYVDMRQWSLFTGVFYFKEKPHSYQIELPFAFVEVHPILQQIARSRGFFALGFASSLFYQFTPLEQRLAVYLAKKFISQAIHRRFVDDLASALPIEAARPDNLRTILKRIVDGLLAKKLPILSSFSFEKSRDGRWLAVFTRKVKPHQDYTVPAYAAEALSPAVEVLVEDMIAATGCPDDRLWWIQCAKRLPEDSVRRGLGQLKETCQLRQVKNRGGMLTKILKDIARETGQTIH